MTDFVVPFRRAASLRRSRAAIVAAGAAVLVLALIAGVLIGRGSATPATHVVRAGSASLVVPRDWHPVPTRTAGIRDLDPQRTVVLSTSEGSPVVVTLAPVQSVTLLPDAFGGVTPGAVTRPAIASFAGYRALRYSALASPKPGELIDATVLPTSNGIVSVACVGGDAECASDVQSVTVPGGSILNPTPDLALALAAPDALSKLDQARVRERAALQRATTRADQQLSSGRLADAYTAAATALAPFALSPSTPLIADLTATAAAYGELGHAVQSGSSADFDQARARIRTSESSLERAIGDLSAGPAQKRGAAPAPVKGARDLSPLLLLLVIVVFAALGVGLALRRPRKVNVVPTKPALVAAPPPEPEPLPERVAEVGRPEDPIAQVGPPEEPIAQPGPPKERIAAVGPREEPVAAVEPPEEPVAQPGPPEEPIAKVGPREEPVAAVEPPEEPAAQAEPPTVPVAEVAPPEDPAAQAEPPAVPVAEVEPPEKPAAHVEPPAVPVAEVEPPEEPAAAAPEPQPERAPAPEPRPDQRELLAAIAAAEWTCELTWSANLRSAGFRARASARGERAREAARSGKLNHPPLVPPAPEPNLIQPARAVAKALVAAGWTPTTRGDHWYSQRFAWTHDGAPPELGAIEVPQATVRNLRRGRPSRSERTTA